jgi:hypothetical protein
LIVTSAPDILWVKDTDGDGQADVRNFADAVRCERAAAGSPRVRSQHI